MYNIENFEVRPRRNTFYFTVFLMLLAVSALVYFLAKEPNINSFRGYFLIAGFGYLVSISIFQMIHSLKKTPVISIDEKCVKILSTFRFRKIPWKKIKYCKTEVSFGVDYFVIETSGFKKKIMISYFDKTPEEIDSVVNSLHKK